ncbi:MAG: polysaccharide pyruvyl transferase family protein [Ktedonobacterales bacterium]|nr:polysaccharide pyruvyl transferase family protein [Ktedonobacterales bacterium]
MNDGATPVVARARRIVIANYSGYILGDDAIFEALLAMLRRAYGPSVAFDALTALPERTRARYPVGEAEHIYDYLGTARTRGRVWRMLARADLLVIGGGDLLEGQRALLVLVALASLLGTPVVLAGIGVLRPETARRRHLLRWTARRASLIAVRDAESARLLGEVGVRQPAPRVLPDLAVGLEPPAPGLARALLAAEGLDLSRPYIALNLRVPDPGQYGMRWGEEEYAAVAHACRVLLDREACDVIAVPMVRAATMPATEAMADDQLLYHLTERIARPGRVHVLRGDYRPMEVAALLGGARVAVGMRLHFLLLAAASGVPIVALSYAPKVQAFMERVGLEHVCLEMSGITPFALERGISTALTECAIITSRLAAWYAEAHDQLQSLEREFAALAYTRPAGHIRRGAGLPLGAPLRAALALSSHRKGYHP